jgi:hypothetical protein
MRESQVFGLIPVAITLHDPRTPAGCLMSYARVEPGRERRRTVYSNCVPTGQEQMICERGNGRLPFVKVSRHSR